MRWPAGRSGAALEDALKHYAASNGLDVDDASMSKFIGALKSKGLVSGAQKSLLTAMLRMRNHAMHAAQWPLSDNIVFGPREMTA